MIMNWFWFNISWGNCRNVLGKKTNRFGRYHFTNFIFIYTEFCTAKIKLPIKPINNSSHGIAFKKNKMPPTRQ